MRRSAKVMAWVIGGMWPVWAGALDLGGIPGLGGGPSVGGGTRVVGECSSGSIATPSNVANAASWVGGQVVLVGQAIETGLTKQSALMEEIHKSEVTSMRELFVEFGAAQERLKAERTYGEGSQPKDGCGSPELGTGLAQGRAGTRAASQRVAEDLRAYNAQFADPLAWARYREETWALPEEAVPLADALDPESGTVSVEQFNNARRMIELTTNPAPPLPAPDGTEGEQAWVDYEQLRRMHSAELSLPQKALSDLLTDHSPTVPLGQWALDAWHDMGRSGDPDGVQDGYISTAALRQLLVDARYANPSWYQHILADANEVGLQREAVLMQAVQLDLQLSLLNQLQTLTGLIAQQEANRVKEAYGPAIDVKWGELVAPTVRPMEE